MKDTFYFPHDYNARGDQKITRLLKGSGWEGYGLYWAIVEQLYEAKGRLDLDFDSLAFDLRTTEAKIKPVVCDYKLFYFKNGKFGSISVDRRLEERRIKSEKATASANAKHNHANAQRTHSERTGSALLERKERKEIKERKETPVDFQAMLYDKDFQAFKKAYPKWTGEHKAYEAWCSIQPNAELQAIFIKAIENQKKVEPWLSNMVHAPANWLNDGHWLDHLPGNATSELDRMKEYTARVTKEQKEREKQA